MNQAEFFISPTGRPDGCGSAADPFGSPMQALKSLRKLDHSDFSAITVTLLSGRYPISGLDFGPEDGVGADIGYACCGFDLRYFGFHADGYRSADLWMIVCSFGSFGRIVNHVEPVEIGIERFETLFESHFGNENHSQGQADA